MSGVAFTGERLHEGSELFAVDLVRHRAAYAFAIERAKAGRILDLGGRVLDLGCGSGYGTAELADSCPGTVGVDRIAPDPQARGPQVRFLRADLRGIPLANASFDLVVSFQVIEHLEDPGPYLAAIARLLRPNGTALISTPNLLQSDGENPFHVHEYMADELARTLQHHFRNVEMRGVGASAPAAHYYGERLRQIRRIVRLDPLRLRHRLPRWLIDWMFAKLALVVRRGIRRQEGLPQVGLSDFPVGNADEECLDLLAVCGEPIA